MAWAAWAAWTCESRSYAEFRQRRPAADIEEHGRIRVVQAGQQSLLRRIEAQLLLAELERLARGQKSGPRQRGQDSPRDEKVSVLREILDQAPEHLRARGAVLHLVRVVDHEADRYRGSGPDGFAQVIRCDQLPLARFDAEPVEKRRAEL